MLFFCSFLSFLTHVKDAESKKSAEVTTEETDQEKELLLLRKQKRILETTISMSLSGTPVKAVSPLNTGGNNVQRLKKKVMFILN